MENLETPCNLAGTHNQEHSCHQELRFNLDDPGNLDICYIQPEYQHQTTLYSLQHRKAVKFNDQRNRAATLRVDFGFRRIRRSGSRYCSLAIVPLMLMLTLSR